MAKRLCCGFRGKIYYTDVNEKEGIMVGQRVEVTESAVEAVMEWKPKKGELVYTFCYCIGSNDKWTVTWRHWENRVEEIALLKAGWIYRSRAEAERALQDVAVEEGVKRGL